jgi:hypothetical protein
MCDVWVGGGDVDRWAAASRAAAEVNEEDRLVFRGGWVWMVDD